jgi:hypothetical protein
LSLRRSVATQSVIRAVRERNAGDNTDKPHPGIPWDAGVGAKPMTEGGNGRMSGGGRKGCSVWKLKSGMPPQANQKAIYGCCGLSGLRAKRQSVSDTTYEVF